MKHTATLTTLAAAALAAAVPLAAQAQTSQLTISVGPEPAIEPTLTCNGATGGTLVPVVQMASTDSNGTNGRLIRFTTATRLVLTKLCKVPPRATPPLAPGRTHPNQHSPSHGRGDRPRRPTNSFKSKPRCLQTCSLS